MDHVSLCPTKVKFFAYSVEEEAGNAQEVKMTREQEHCLEGDDVDWLAGKVERDR